MVLFTAPIWLAIYTFLINKNAGKGKYTRHQLLVHGNIVFTLLLGVLLIIVFTPISETMTCSEDLSCKIETGYLAPFLNKTEEFKVLEGSYIDVIEKREENNSHQQVMFYPAIYNSTKTNPQIFKMYSVERHDGGGDYVPVNVSEYGQRIIKKDAAIFQQYKKDPKQEYTIESSLDASQLNSRIIRWTLFMLLILFLNLKLYRDESIINMLRNFVQKFIKVIMNIYKQN